MKIKNVDRVEDAEKLRNKFMYVSREDSRELEEGEFFIADMIGMDVYTLDNNHIGTLKDVLQYAANDVYVIKSNDGKEFLIPAITKFVPTIDINERKMIIDPIKGYVRLGDSMRFHIMTLFPEIFHSYMNESIMKKAVEKNIIEVNIYNIRDFLLINIKK